MVRSKQHQLLRSNHLCKYWNHGLQHLHARVGSVRCRQGLFNYILRTLTVCTRTAADSQQVVATSIFVMFGIEKFGRRMSLVCGLAAMSVFLWIIGAIFNTHR
jgi:hypothetical protein